MVVCNVFYQIDVVFKIKSTIPCCRTIWFLAVVVSAVFGILRSFAAQCWYGVYKIYYVINICYCAINKSKVLFIVLYKNKVVIYFLIQAELLFFL